MLDGFSESVPLENDSSLSFLHEAGETNIDKLVLLEVEEVELENSAVLGISFLLGEDDVCECLEGGGLGGVLDGSVDVGLLVVEEEFQGGLALIVGSGEGGLEVLFHAGEFSVLADVTFVVVVSGFNELVGGVQQLEVGDLGVVDGLVVGEVVNFHLELDGLCVNGVVGGGSVDFVDFLGAEGFNEFLFDVGGE